MQLACERCASPLEREDLRCPICNAVAPLVIEEDLERTDVEVLRCDGCGAAVSYEVRAQAPACAFCGLVMRVEAADDPPEKVEFFLPFTVDRARAEAALRDWLGRLGWFRPGDLKSASRVESLTPLWWVGWVFDAEAKITWAADSDAGAGRSDWAPHAGETEFVFENVIAPASRGLTAAETAHLIPTYDLTTAEDAPEVTEKGTTVEVFNLPRSSARERVADFIQQAVVERLKAGYIPGKRFRNVHASVVLRKLITRRFTFPSFVLAYRYRGALYRVVISGHDASCVLGKAPYSVARILTVIAGAVVATSVVAALILALL